MEYGKSPGRRRAKDMSVDVSSFLLGGVSALLAMGLLLFFMEHPVKKPKDNRFSKQIADTLTRFIHEGAEGRFPRLCFGGEEGNEGAERRRKEPRRVMFR
jgi:hypothetical protein